MSMDQSRTPLASYISVTFVFLFTDAVVTLAFNGEFGLGVGTIQFADVGCIGNEISLLNCTNAGIGLCSNHTLDVGVDCMGRLLRKFWAL